MHGHMYTSYAYAKDKERMKCVGPVIVSIDTVQAYTSHPPIIRAYCSLRFLLSLRGILACL